MLPPCDCSLMSPGCFDVLCSCDNGGSWCLDWIPQIIGQQRPSSGAVEEIPKCSPASADMRVLRTNTVDTAIMSTLEYRATGHGT